MTSTSSDEWIAIDFETASVRATPCQVGAVRYRDGVEIETFSTLIFQDPASFYPFNMALHGITPKMVAGAPTWPSVRERLLEFADRMPLVAHNAPFDMGVLQDASVIHRLGWPSVTYACTLAISRRVWPGMSSYSLALLCDLLCIPTDPNRCHDALYDAQLAAEVLNRAKSDTGTATLLDLLERYRIRLGEITADSWHGATAQPTSTNVAVNTEADPTTPLFSRVVAFTGELAIPRREAQQLVANAGGVPADGVNRKTNYLVCGHQDLLKLGAGQTRSSKLRKAEALRAQGHEIEIISENDFSQLLELCTPSN
jgi:DNA polymerase III epsilon subunit-like protein